MITMRTTLASLHRRQAVAVPALSMLMLGLLAAQIIPTNQTVVRQAAQRRDPPGWTLTWSDEFDQPDGSTPDPTKWGYDVGGGGWGNNELQTYTNRAKNAQIKRGKLVITAARENYTGADGIPRRYTSARLLSKAKFSQQYGRIEALIKIPHGQGIWPAFWMLGDNIGKVGWPKCGEIDIMENIGKEPAIVHGTIHGPGYSGADGIGAPHSLSSGRFADSFHVFAVEWEEQVMRFYVDGQLYNTITPAKIPAGNTWVYDHPFFLILNVAVGGNWPGDPDRTTRFPQTMQVEYVRVYKLATP